MSRPGDPLVTVVAVAERDAPRRAAPTLPELGPLGVGPRGRADGWRV